MTLGLYVPMQYLHQAFGSVLAKFEPFGVDVAVLSSKIQTCLILTFDLNFNFLVRFKCVSWRPFARHPTRLAVIIDLRISQGALSAPCQSSSAETPVKRRLITFWTPARNRVNGHFTECYGRIFPRIGLHPLVRLGRWSRFTSVAICCMLA